MRTDRPRFFYGWVVLATAALLSFVQTVTFNPTLSVFLKPMTAEFNWSRAAFAGSVSLGSLAGGLFTLGVGPLVDRRGARLVLAVAAAVLGGSLVLVSRFASLWQFYLFYGLGRAMSVGVIEVSSIVSVSNWFIRKRGRALGIVTAGTRTGQALMPLLAQAFIVAWGWRVGWLGLGLFAWALGIVPALLFMRRRPEDVGLLPDGEVMSQGSAAANEPRWKARAAVRTSTFWLITLAFAGTFMATGAVNLHQLPHMVDVGIPAHLAVGTVTVWALCATVGAFLWPLLAERAGITRSLALALLLSALGIFLLIQVRNVAMAYTYAVLYGLTFGGIFPMFSLAYATFFGRTSQATIRGVAQPLLMLANATGPVLGGWVYDVTASYTLAFVIFMGAFLLGIPLVLLSRAPRQAGQPAA